MAKAFLLRFGSENDFKSIKLQTRELGFAIDSEKLYVGGEDKNIHIPSEDFVKNIVEYAISNRTNIEGSTQELQEKQKIGSVAYNSDTKRMQFVTKKGTKIEMASKKDLLLTESSNFTVTDENIDSDDENSVTLGSFYRPYVMVFLNGILVTNNSDDNHQYTYDNSAGTLKIKQCAAGDIIAYF